MLNDRAQLVHVLDAIENDLRALKLWACEAPENIEQAACSPFGVGEIEFHSWLQFVLLQRLRDAVEQESALPQSMLVHPFAQEYYRGQWGRYKNLIAHLRSLDLLFLD